MNVIKRPGGHRSRRYVFREQHSLADMELIARGSSWTKVADQSSNAEQGRPLVIRWEVIPGLNVTYTEEDSIASSFAMVTSRIGAEPVDSAVAIFEVHPRVVPVEELISELDSAHGTSDEPLALVRAGLGAPLDPDQRLIQRISTSLHSTDDRIREGGLWAVSYSEWPIFRDSVRQLSERDHDKFIREFAAGVLEVFDQLGLEN